MRTKHVAKRIEPTKYKTRCTIEEPLQSVADMHSVEIVWRHFCHRWIAEGRAFGNEITQGMTSIPQKRGVLMTRSDSQSRAITPRMRIRICDRVLNIEAVDDDGGERREVIIRYIEESPV